MNIWKQVLNDHQWDRYKPLRALYVHQRNYYVGLRVVMVVVSLAGMLLASGADSHWD